MSNRSSPPKSDKEQKPVEGQGGASGKKQDYHTNMPVGEILRRAREHYGQSLPDVESAIRIRASQIDAIEKSQYDRLPGRVYAIGFVRSYSEYLGFDGDKMVSLFKSQSVGGGRIKPELNFPAPASESRLPPVWLVVIGGILFAGFMVFWASQNVIDHDTIAAVPTVPALKAEAETAPEAPLDISEQAVPEEDAEQVASDTAVPDAVEEIPVGEDVVSAPEDSEAAAPVSKIPLKAEVVQEAEALTEEEPVEEAAPAEEAMPPADQAKAPARTDGITLNVIDNSWVEIKDESGKAIVSRMLKKGDQYFVPNRPDLKMSLGNAGGIEIIMEGKTLPPLGKKGEVRRNLSLDMKVLKALASPQ